jgi:RNA polymerase sigma factor (TIGR02999 family)
MTPQPPITELIRRWGSGDKDAADRLFPLIYQELRRMARGYLQGEAPGHTLQATAIVHELYLKLLDQELQLQDRGHFYAVAARQMRHLLIDHARAGRAEKRGGKRARADLAPADLAMIAAPEGKAFAALALDEALTELEKLDERVAKVVELRYFAGLSEAEAAETMDISVATLKRDWQFAQTWLRSRLT